MKTIFATTSALLMAGSFAISAPTVAQANIFGLNEIKRWDMCDWERIPENVLRRIENRNDYDDILRRMFESCPEQALGLTDRPTASVAGDDSGFGGNDDQRGREPDSTDNDNDGPGDTGSTPDGPGNNSPESEDPGNEDPGNGGPGDGGPGDDGPGDDGPGDDGPDDEGPGDDGPDDDGPDEDDFGLPG